MLPPQRPLLNGAVERNQGAWRYEFYASFDLPHRIDKRQPLVDAVAFASITTDHIRHLATSLQQPTSLPSEAVLPRLI